ncbi:TRIM11, partial [Symbiodinium necroappetens]
AKEKTLSIDEDLLPIPHGLLCVICRDPFKDPVFTEDGHSYCRGCILGWFGAHDSRVREFYEVPANIAPHSRKMPPTLLAPMTQLPLTSRTLQPNIALKQAVEAFRSERPAEEARERERRQLLQKVEEAKAAEGDLKSNFNQELEALHGKMQDLQDQLGQANVDLQAAKEEAVKLQEKAEVCAGDDFDELEYELAQLESEFEKESTEDLGLIRLPYHTEIPGQRPSIERSEGLGACAMFYQRTLSTPGLLFKQTYHRRQCSDRMPSCATETDFISAMKTEEQSLVPGSSSNAETPATPAGQLAPLAPAGKAPKRRQASCRVSWAQFRASKLPQIKADLERQWEMLMADAEARDLLTMRYDSASPHAALAQFREELDRMIVERTQTLERGAAASGPATRAPRSVAQISLLKIQDCEVSRGKTTPSLSRSSSSDVPSPSALLRRLGCAHGFAQ